MAHFGPLWGIEVGHRHLCRVPAVAGLWVGRHVRIWRTDNLGCRFSKRV